MVFLTDEHILNRQNMKGSMASKKLTYGLGTLLTLAVCAVIVLLAGRGSGTRDSDKVFSSSGEGIRYTVESPVYLYFQDRKNGVLVAEERLISHEETPVEFAKTILSWLIRGPQQGLARTLPAGTSLRALYINDNTAFVDFSREIRDNYPGGVQTEYLTIVSIANSLILNIPEIKRVKLLIEGRESPTLSGHIDLSQPFSANMLLVR